MITPLQMGVFETIELHRLIAQGQGESLLSDMCRDRLDNCFRMLSQEDKEFLTEVSAKLQTISHFEQKNDLNRLVDIINNKQSTKDEKDAAITYLVEALVYDVPVPKFSKKVKK